jgi:hypothetical protein
MIAPLTKFYGWPASGPGSAWDCTGPELARWEAGARAIIAASKKPKGR